MHVSTFLSIIDELAAQDQTLTDAEKETKILRALLDYFHALKMASSLNENSFNEIVTAVQANIEHKKKRGFFKPSNTTQSGLQAQLADGSNCFPNIDRNSSGHGNGCGCFWGHCGRQGGNRHSQAIEEILVLVHFIIVAYQDTILTFAGVEKQTNPPDVFVNTNKGSKVNITTTTTAVKVWSALGK